MMSTDEKGSELSPSFASTQTVEKVRVESHSISAQDMAVDKKGIYRNYNEVVDAVRDGTFDVGRNSVWHQGRLYFLCTKENPKYGDGRGNDP